MIAWLTFTAGSLLGQVDKGSMVSVGTWFSDVVDTSAYYLIDTLNDSCQLIETHLPSWLLLWALIDENNKNMLEDKQLQEENEEIHKDLEVLLRSYLDKVDIKSFDIYEVDDEVIWNWRFGTNFIQVGEYIYTFELPTLLWAKFRVRRISQKWDNIKFSTRFLSMKYPKEKIVQHGMELLIWAITWEPLESLEISAITLILQDPNKITQ